MYFFLFFIVALRGDEVLLYDSLTYLDVVLNNKGHPMRRGPMVRNFPYLFRGILHGPVPSLLYLDLMCGIAVGVCERRERRRRRGGPGRPRGGRGWGGVGGCIAGGH